MKYLKLLALVISSVAVLSCSSDKNNKHYPPFVPQAPVEFKDFFVGVFHTVATDVDGELYAWGTNSDGQLGIGNTEEYKTTPTPVIKPVGVTSFLNVYVGLSHTIAAGNDYNLYTWGTNSDGQLGVGDKLHRNVPTLVTLPQGVASFGDVYPGANNTIVQGSDNKYYAWGQNTFGKLGVGDEDNKSVPTLVKMPVGVDYFPIVFVGAVRTVALGNDDHLYTWGMNSSGELGVGDEENKSVPTLVKMPVGVTSFKDIFIGEVHTIAQAVDDNYYAWGRNENGQLGVGDEDNKSVPTLVKMPTGVTSFDIVLLGDFHTIAKGNDGNLYAWGENDNGQLGVGDKLHRNVPTLITLPEGVTSFTDVYSGGYSVLAKGNNGKLYAWGQNISGQLGVGDKVDRSVPTLVTLPEGVTSFEDVFTKNISVIAKGSDKKFYAWGHNFEAQLGVGDKVDRSVPTLILGQK